MRKVIAKECRFAMHRPIDAIVPDDVHLIKEILHYDDGATEPNLRVLRNFERPYWVTKPKFRNHKEKKEWEVEERLDMYKSIQSDLAKKVSRTLNAPWSQRTLYDLSVSPYLYGSDISSTSLIKNGYMTKNPDKITPFTIAAFDIETKTRFGNAGLIAEIASVSFQNKILLVVCKDYFDDEGVPYSGINKIITGESTHEEEIKKCFSQYLGDLITERKLELEIKIVDTEIEIYKECFKKLHEWMPDFLVIWNIDYEMTRLLEACQRADYKPADLFTDPTLDENLKYFKYKRGATSKQTASGKWIPINPSQQWHVVYSMASFYPICAMSSYRFLRLGSAEEKNYKLDTILAKNGIGGKLKFEEADGLKEKAWHDFMQSKYKYQYCVYNIYDSVCLHLLNEKTIDLSIKLPMYSEACDFEYFNSMTKRLGSIFHYEARADGKVIGTVPPKPREDKNKPPTEEELLFAMEEEYEEDSTDGDEDEEEDDTPDEVLSLKDWIVTLAAYKVDDNGLLCIKGEPFTRTNLRGAVFDLDAVGAYPSCMQALDVSKETTKREIIGIKGVDEHVFRRQGINLLSGPVNAIDYCVQMFGFPEPDDLLRSFKESIGL